MRRQARKSVGGALIVRTASALQVWLWLLLFVFQNEFRISESIQPGYLDFDNLPETNFTCTGKVIGGYYADLETSCQMFHVCTVGQQEEPMDIKFLCLNGTVFDQETRVCERVDEVDCTKSEKFYSLNLELYGSTAPPIIQPETEKPQIPTTDRTIQQNKYSTSKLTDPFTNDSPTTPEKIQNQSTEVVDSTEDPVQEYKKDENKITSAQPPLPAKEQAIIAEEYEEDEEAIDSEGVDYEEDYSHLLTTTTAQTITTTFTTTRRPPTSTTLYSSSTRQSSAPQIITSPSPSLASLTTSSHSSLASSITPPSNLDPTLLSPQEFIYRHRGPGSEAISFQRQSFRPADGVYITHAPPQQFDHFQYESSRTAPRPVVSHPVPFVQRPQPTPFRPTTIDPRNQILRPISTSSERHETSVKHRPQNYPIHHLPPQPPLPFNPFYYDRKRSDDTGPENESSLSARSVAPPTKIERPPPKPKSPPRVIVTASASVSDSNGKKLNYTVGNVVSAVKPIVAINYDDYKESDLLFDPFFLDVPKLQARRKTRSSKYRNVVSVPATTAETIVIVPEKTSTTTFSKLSQTATQKKIAVPHPSTTVHWNPEDYVDDNYEPHAYVPPVPPLAVLLHQDHTKPRVHERPSVNKLVEDKMNDLKLSHVLQSKSTSSEVRKISSQSVGVEATVPITSQSPLEVPTCITSRSNDCRSRA